VATPEQGRWFEPKSREELYRIADDPEFADALAQHRVENERHLLNIRDSVFYPEGMSDRHFDTYQSNIEYPIEAIIELTNSIGLDELMIAMSSDDSSMLFWAITGTLFLGEDSREAIPALRKLLSDPEPVVQLEAARALVGLGELDDVIPLLRKYLTRAANYSSLRALLVIDDYDLLSVDASLRDNVSQVKGLYTERLIEKLLNVSEARN